MKLPSLSSSMYVARLRYIQSIHESPEHRNPDTLVRHFIPILQRWRSAWLSRRELAALRRGNFYYYLIARTRYYDQIVQEAISENVRQIVMIGCGSDTRAYRFQALLRQKGVRVLECDQAEAIHIKQQMAMRWNPGDYVEYMPIDLNADSWGDFERWLADRSEAKTLVMMEGVSAYINDNNFQRFLRLLATKVLPGSFIAYDFKIGGANDDLGRAGKTREPFRLSRISEEVGAFHEKQGLRLEQMMLSSELCLQQLPGLAESDARLFDEDGLLRLTVRR